VDGSLLDKMSNAAPTALTIAGSDSGGGAGIQADLKSFSALGVYGASVITAVTAQNTQKVTAVHGIPDEIVAAQIKAVLVDIRIDALKIGMLATSSIIQTVANELESQSSPIVLDPVMIAKSGDSLLQEEAISALRTYLLPMATLLTPNLPEAAVLLGAGVAKTLDEMENQGRALLTMGPQTVLMKGGHAKGANCVDVLIPRDAPAIRLSAPRIKTTNTHGTGCTLSSSITAGLAKGLTISEATREAHSYLQGAINAADVLSIGSGHGPVHHFYESWS
jgi:hydroxymethylpyrimidine/phosphomethylpyrimidine kinase